MPIFQGAAWLALLLLTSTLIPADLHARQAGEPRSWSLAAKAAGPVPVLTLEAVDAERLLADDAAGDAAAKGGGALRYAVPRAVDATPADSGRWLRLADGGRLWQLRLQVPGATDLNLAFSRLVLPAGASLHLFSTSERYYEGPYTANDLAPPRRFWSPVVPGEEAVVELYLPPGAGGATLELAAVNAGYRDLFARKHGPVLKQGSCNVDVACPLGDAYRDEIRSVARYSIRGQYLCSGTLMMDAAASFRPWFLTAAHCGVDGEAAADSVVVYWNYQSPSCGMLSGGSLADNQTGAAFRALREDVDMSLIELDARPPAAFDVHYAGWDRTGAAPIGSMHIHHPGGDEKALSFNDDPLTTMDNCVDPGASTHWRIDTYEQGVTERGSSGSGIWTQAPNPRLIGFLTGGNASCSYTSGFDCYGKFSVAWDGDSPASRLRDWLGGGLSAPPLGVDGSDPQGFSIALDPPALALCRSDADSVAVALAPVADFDDPVTLAASGAPSGVSTGFTPGQLVPPGTSSLRVATNASAAAGDYVLQVHGSASGASRSAPLALRIDASAPSAPATQSPAAGAANVDLFPVFSWSAVAGASAYRLEVAPGGDFAQPVIDVVVEGTRHAATRALRASGSYSWRVRALNACGSGTASPVRMFTTGTAWCRNEVLAIPDGDPTGATVTVEIEDARLIADLDVAVQVGHSYVGDLAVLLRHEDSGTGVRVIDRPGVPASTLGCPRDNIDATLDDEAVHGVEHQCVSAGTAISGSFRPNEALSAFDGAAFGGHWSLQLSDAVTGDTGTLTRWCLRPTFQAAVPPLFVDGFEVDGFEVDGTH